MNLTLANGSTVSVEALDYSNLRDAFNEFFVDFELRVKGLFLIIYLKNIAYFVLIRKK